MCYFYRLSVVFAVFKLFQPPWGGGLLPWGGGLLPWGGMMRRITLNMSDLESLQRLSRCMLIFAPCEALCSIALCGHVTARKL